VIEDVYSADKAGGVRLIDRTLEAGGFISVLTADVDVCPMSVDGDGREECALDQFMRLIREDLAVFARAGLAFVAVDDKKMGGGARGRECRPFDAGERTTAAPPAELGEGDFTLQKRGATGNEGGRVDPVTA
jgi:hypothetical protein